MRSDARLPTDAQAETTRVRQGKTLGVMRWVLLASVSITVIALAVAFLATPMR